VIVNVAVFSTRGESVPIRAEIYTMHGTEMSVNISQLVPINHREHLHLESTSICACLRDIFGVLATSSEDVELLVLRVVIERRQDG